MAGDGAPSSMIVQFTTLEGERTGPQIDIPMASTVPQMEELINQLLENEDKVMLSFSTRGTGNFPRLIERASIVKKLTFYLTLFHLCRMFPHPTFICAFTILKYLK